jgi:hypothetical protein
VEYPLAAATSLNALRIAGSGSYFVSLPWYLSLARGRCNNSGYNKMVRDFFHTVEARHGDI